MGDHQLKIAVSGAGGFIGTRLARSLAAQGHAVVPLTRGLFAGNFDTLVRALDGCHGVVNLAGAPIDRRWSESYKRELRDSRIGTTLRLTAAVNALADKPRVFVSTSAAGYYPDEGCYDEFNAVKGTGFLSDLCRDWEQATSLLDPQVRLCITRFGVVLAGDGGAFPRMAAPFRAGIAARIGNGRQPFAWIAADDLVRALEFLLADGAPDGIFNFVAPERTDNASLTRALARHYGDRVGIGVPRGVFRVMYGEMSSVLTSGQCVIPARLPAAGFRYEYPSIGAFLAGLK